ncbi:TetR/AcrR family transcriptional regulator [Actinocorallia populi]|uniref:TetR/AcrR family transcriptional regulator n=1 Tax=Actinocorallia populi TaxID=2079200 RepID=UPI000D095DBF|nr:TetR/AcrR family transcriptional regulator [Actinocorallia populi]
MSERSLREQRRERRRELGRDQILDVAEEVFARKGFHDASLREIAELAEYSVGAVYGFFTGKDELYREIFLRRATVFLGGMKEVFSSPHPPQRQLLDLAEWQVGFFRAHPEYGRLVLRSGSIASALTGAPSDGEILANFRQAQEMQAELFRRGQRTGVLKGGDPHLLARMFSGLVSAFQASELAEEGPVPLPLTTLLETVEAAFVIAES